MEHVEWKDFSAQTKVGASDRTLAPTVVRLKGLEPTRIAAREPKSRMSTNSITGAYFILNKTDSWNLVYHLWVWLSIGLKRMA